jgi:hypothetical protein
VAAKASIFVKQVQNEQPLPEERKVDRVPVLKQNILRALGTPKRMQKFAITHIAGDHYRVTIYCQRENKSLMMGFQNFIAYSLWIKTNAEGDIVSCDPPVQKMYS